MRLLGVDPGRDGATATWRIIPGRTDQLDGYMRIKGLAESELVKEVALADIIYFEWEKSWMSKASARWAGYYQGLFMGIAAATKTPMIRVPSRTWMKEVLPGYKKTKEAKPSLEFCRLRLPECSITHDGIADAICIAYYGRSQQIWAKPKTE